MPDVAMNVTTGLSSMGDAPSWFGIFAIVGITTVVLLLCIIAISSIQQYRRAKGFIAWLIRSFNYFLMGIASIGVLAVPTLAVAYFLNQAHEGNVAPLKWTGVIIGGYFAIAGLGYVCKKFIYDRIKHFEEVIHKHEKKEHRESPKVY